MYSKQDRLKELIRSYGKVAIAYSSGVDSTYLLKIAYDELRDNCVAITASSGSFPKRELEESCDFTKDNGIKHIVVTTNELEIEGFRDNPPNRCYLCKKAIFQNIINAADECGIGIVAEASNIDDNGDYRPGMIAIDELGVKSPLREVGLTKAEIRALSKDLGLYTWQKPAYACLATRFAYGEEITDSKLQMVDKAEQLLMDMGLGQLRVRIHDNIARIEALPEDFDKIMNGDTRERIYSSFQEFGFKYVALDLRGYRMGSMNETLDSEILRKGRRC